MKENHQHLKWGSKQPQKLSKVCMYIMFIIFYFHSLNCMQVFEKGLLKEQKKEKDAHSNLTNKSASPEFCQVH